MSQENIHAIKRLIDRGTGGWLKCTIWNDESGLDVSRGGRIYADIETEKEALAFLLAFVATKEEFES